MGSLLITYEWSDWNNATYFWIQSVYVDTAWRRRGVYRALYEHVLSAAAKRGDNCGIRLYVERANTVAQQAYTSLGMHQVPLRSVRKALRKLSVRFENLTPGMDESS